MKIDDLEIRSNRKIVTVGKKYNIAYEVLNGVIVKTQLALSI